MKMRNLLFPGILWIFSLFLALLPSSVKAGEMRSFFRYAAMLTRDGISEGSARILRLHHAVTVHAQSANGWPIGTRNEVVLALPHGSGRTEALLDANDSKCSGDGSGTITSAANLQMPFVSHHSRAGKTIPTSH